MQLTMRSMATRGAVLCLIVLAGTGAADDTPPAATQPADGDPCGGIRDAQTVARDRLAERAPVLRKTLASLTEAVDTLDARLAQAASPEQMQRKDQLLQQRAAAQDELKFLESAQTAWEAALNDCVRAEDYQRALDRFRTPPAGEHVSLSESEIPVLRAQLEQLNGALSALDAPQSVQETQLADVEARLAAADDSNRPRLEAERDAKRAELEAIGRKRAARRAEQALITAKLATVAPAAAVPATSPSTAPTPDQLDVDNVQRVVEKLEAEARSGYDIAQTRVAELKQRREQPGLDALAALRLETDLAYWERMLEYESSNLRKVGLRNTIKQHKAEIANLRERLSDARTTLGQLQPELWDILAQPDPALAAEYDRRATEEEATGAKLSEQAAAESKELESLKLGLSRLDAEEKSLGQRVDQAEDAAQRNLLRNHVERMRALFGEERELTDLLILSSENIIYGLERQATLRRELADVHRQCALTVNPPDQSRWANNVAILRSFGILVLTFALTYVIKLLIWIARWPLNALECVPGAHISAKRAGTLLKFFGSIARLFIWVFGVLLVLNQFGVDPAKSTGALGLIGLIMTGMFREIVVDFVKGFDIITGRHYDVGDFIEVDGAYGHVVDFNVKHTRIRTLSGQILNIPNSRCVPSRRFPEGYVDNFVDIMLKSRDEADRARVAIDAACRALNRRIEPLRETPLVTRRIADRDGCYALRYRLRVLPGCGWVVTDHFIPMVKDVLASVGQEMVNEPTFFFMNRVETFRRLFSRKLSEDEIIREVADEHSGPTEPPNESPPGAE